MNKLDVWHDDCMKMPLNTFCRAVVDWTSWSTDGDSTEHGETEAIVLKYKDNCEECFRFIHKGDKQYLHETFDIIKWQLLG